MINQKNNSKNLENHKKIHTIIDFYNEYDEQLIRCIKSYLFLEYIMNTILEKLLNTKTEKYTYNKKTYLLYNHNLINDRQKNLLISINRKK